MVRKGKDVLLEKKNGKKVYKIVQRKTMDGRLLKIPSQVAGWLAHPTPIIVF